MNFIKLYKVPIILALISITFYISFAYNLERSDFVTLITLYAGLFGIAYILIEKFKLSFWWLASLGILFRLIFIIAMPNLSQDFNRFIWDGRLLAQGINPYLFTPESYIQDLKLVTDNNLGLLSFKIPQAEELFQGMGALNANNYSNYPPINQLFFALSALFSKTSILRSFIVLRTIIIFADIGILYFGKKLLEKLQLPINKIFWFFLNPFIIIELTGNIHFEGVMLFFFVWALNLLSKRKWIWAAVLIGISISVKLIPLLLLPLFLKFDFSKRQSAKFQNHFGMVSLRKLISFYMLVGLTVLITFLPFLSSEFIENFSSTIALWFQNFEFNASVYYIIRWIGFQIVGFNIIETVGKILPIIIFISIVILAIFRDNSTMKKLITAMLLSISIYFLFSTTVHPWYVATPLLLCVFTKYKFPIVWSFVVMLSYSAYGKNGFSENLLLVALEYILVIGFAIWEINSIKKPINS